MDSFGMEKKEIINNGIIKDLQRWTPFLSLSLPSNLIFYFILWNTNFDNDIFLKIVTIFNIKIVVVEFIIFLYNIYIFLIYLNFSVYDNKEVHQHQKEVLFGLKLVLKMDQNIFILFCDYHHYYYYRHQKIKNV